MPNNDPPSAGVLQVLRRLCDTGVALLHNRIELFAVELQEQKARLVKVLLLAGAAIFLGNTAILVLTAAIVILAGADARVPVVVGLCVLYVVAAAVAFLALRKEIRSAPRPFNGTLAELKKDREWLMSRK
jgi:uncharacterized membrane protein YqjE